MNSFPFNCYDLYHRWALRLWLHVLVFECLFNLKHNTFVMSNLIILVENLVSLFLLSILCFLLLNIYQSKLKFICVSPVDFLEHNVSDSFLFPKSKEKFIDDKYYQISC